MGLYCAVLWMSMWMWYPVQLPRKELVAGALGPRQGLFGAVDVVDVVVMVGGVSQPARRPEHKTAQVR